MLPPQPPSLVVGVRCGLSPECGHPRVQDAPEALGAVRGVAERREPVQVPHPRDVEGRDQRRAAASLALTALGLTGDEREPKVDIALDGAW